jgi:hypothetical protein
LEEPHSLQWKSVHFPGPNKARMSQSRIKTVLIILFGVKETVMAEYVLHGQES